MNNNKNINININNHWAFYNIKINKPLNISNSLIKMAINDFWNNIVKNLSNEKHSSLWLCHRSWWVTKYSQSWNLCGLMALSEIHWYMMFYHFWFQSRWQSLCQNSVLPNYLAFKETLRKISQTLWNHLSAWHSIIYSPAFRVYTLCSSSLLYVHARTRHVQHFL